MCILLCDVRFALDGVQSVQMSLHPPISWSSLLRVAQRAWHGGCTRLHTVAQVQLVENGWLHTPTGVDKIRLKVEWCGVSWPKNMLLFSVPPIYYKDTMKASSFSLGWHVQGDACARKRLHNPYI